VPAPDVGALLEALGIDAKRSGRTKWLARCPSPDHDDKHPSWFVRDDPGEKRHGFHLCKSCGFGGGLWDLVAAVRGVSVREARAFVRGFARGEDIPRDASVPRVVSRLVVRHSHLAFPAGVEFPREQRQWFEPALRYVLRRASWDQVLRWGVGYATRGKLQHRVVVPVYTAGALRTWSARSYLEDARRYDMARRSDGARDDLAVFGEPGFDGADTATVAEGVWSALALERAGAVNPCALLGSAVTPGKAAVLSRFRRLVVATDPDDAGDAAARAVEQTLGRRLEVVRLRLEQSPDDAPESALRAALWGLGAVSPRGDT